MSKKRDLKEDTLITTERDNRVTAAVGAAMKQFDDILGGSAEDQVESSSAQNEVLVVKATEESTENAVLDSMLQKSNHFEGQLETLSFLNSEEEAVKAEPFESESSQEEQVEFAREEADDFVLTFSDEDSGSSDEFTASPVADDEESKVVLDEDENSAQLSMEGTELDGFDSAQIEVLEEVHEDQIASIVESLLFSTDKPQSIALLKAAFKGTNVRSAQIRRALDQLQIEYAGARRGVYLEEIAGGWQLRTKVDNMDYLRRTTKVKPFKVSGPALEVLSIVAYKQPVVKNQIDEIRGVESGHLLRALMEKGLVHFDGKSELPGKPMYYGTTRRFLETFGLRNLNELPSLNEIDQLIPEGIGGEPEKETLDSLTGQLSRDVGASYSESEEELEKIASDLLKVETTTEFFEQEKARMKAERDQKRAQDIREAQIMGEDVPDSDRKWLDRYERELALQEAKAAEAAFLENQETNRVEETTATEVAESQRTDSSAEFVIALETLTAERPLEPAVVAESEILEVEALAAESENETELEVASKLEPKLDV